MCDLCTQQAAHAPVARRDMFKFAAAAAAAAGFAAAPALAAPPKSPPKPQNALSPDAALERLIKGNARYIDGAMQRHDFQHERAALSEGQNPFAGILGCADSRIAPEFCFDTARGDVFVCRVAGNFATDEIIASFEYAVQVLSTPLIMVLGHEACGAVDATIKAMRDGLTLPGHLPTLTHALAPAVQAAQGQPGDLLNNAIRRNVAMNVARLQTATPILKSFVDDNKLRIVGGIYELKTGKVELVS